MKGFPSVRDVALSVSPSHSHVTLHLHPYAQWSPPKKKRKAQDGHQKAGKLTWDGSQEHCRLEAVKRSQEQRDQNRLPVIQSGKRSQTSNVKWDH